MDELQSSMSFDTFGRWLSRLAIAAIGVAVLSVGAMFFFSWDHFAVGISAIFFLAIGLMLTYAATTLRTKTRLSFDITTGALYVAFAGVLFDNIHEWWADSGILPGAAGVVLALVNIAITTMIFLFLRKLIARIKGRSLLDEGHRESRRQGLLDP
jgi:hypothetical protein